MDAQRLIRRMMKAGLDGLSPGEGGEPFPFYGHQDVQPKLCANARGGVQNVGITLSRFFADEVGPFPADREAASAFCPVAYPLRAPKRAPAQADGDNVKARPIQRIQNRRAFLWDKRMAAKDQVALKAVDGWALAIDPIGR